MVNVAQIAEINFVAAIECKRLFSKNTFDLGVGLWPS